MSTWLRDKYISNKSPRTILWRVQSFKYNLRFSRVGIYIAEISQGDLGILNSNGLTIHNYICILAGIN